MVDAEDINSAFDSILLGEDRLCELGFEEGYRAGAKEGRVEGERLGRQRGQQIGKEIGFYLGFAAEWTEVYQNKTTDKKTTKVLAVLQKLTEIAEAFPLENSKEEDFSSRLDLVRAKFKLLCSLLKISSDYSSVTSGEAW